MLGGPTSTALPMGCYRTTDSSGAEIAGADVPHQIGQDLATKMYGTMAALQIVDTVFYEAQRQVSTRPPGGRLLLEYLQCLQKLSTCCNWAWLMQGRFSFFMTSAGEEATAVASAAALSLEDPVSSLHACETVYAYVWKDSDLVKINLMAFDWHMTACCYHNRSGLMPGQERAVSILKSWSALTKLARRLALALVGLCFVPLLGHPL